MDKVVAVIEFNNKILVGKVRHEEKDAFGGLEYVFPGGSVEESESLEQALFREVKEETGLDVMILGKIEDRVHPVTDKKIHYFYCTSNTDEVDLGGYIHNDLQGYSWVSKKDLLAHMPTLFPAVKEYLKI